MTDPDKHPGHGLDGFLVALHVSQLDGRHLALARIENIRDGRIPGKVNHVIPEEAVLHDL